MNKESIQKQISEMERDLAEMRQMKMELPADMQGEITDLELSIERQIALLSTMQEPKP